MKIAMVVSTFPPDVGGMGQVVREETTRLMERGHEVTVFALQYHRGYQKTASVRRLQAFPRFGDGGFVPSLLWRLRGFDVVHLHYPFYGAGLMVLLACRLLHIRLVVTYHMDARPSGVKRLIQRVADWLVSPAIFRAATTVFTPDQDFIEQAQYGALCIQKLVVVPNGVNTDVFSPGQANWKTLRLPDDWVNKKIILFVGNLLPIKRVDVLLRALTLSKNLSEVLVIVGGGYDEAALRSKVKEYGLDKRTIFVGRVLNQQELVEYYRAASVVVIPSDVESFSLVALEAMATAKALVASAIPGLRRRVVENQTGLLFTPGSPQSLRTQLDTFFALSPQEQAAFGSAARELVLRDYTWDKHSAMLEQYYGTYGV